MSYAYPHVIFVGTSGLTPESKNPRSKSKFYHLLTGTTNSTGTCFAIVEYFDHLRKFEFSDHFLKYKNITKKVLNFVNLQHTRTHTQVNVK